MEVSKVIFVMMVQDMDRAIVFYRDVIGLPLKLHVGGWAELGSEEAVVALHAGGNGEFTDTGLSFKVADVAAACEEVAAAGGRIRQAPENRSGEGITLARLVDTEGNGFTISQQAP